MFYTTDVEDKAVYMILRIPPIAGQRRSQILPTAGIWSGHFDSDRTYCIPFRAGTEAGPTFLLKEIHE
jgi:hypothetical protein